MRISILSPDVSSNAMARTCPIAETLARSHEIQILGFDAGEGFFEPYQDTFDYATVPVGRTPISLSRNVRKLVDLISGDVVYAFQPQLGSLGVALLEKRRRGIPVILDIEDYLRFEEYSLLKKVGTALLRSGSPTNGFYAKALERTLNRVDHITVTSSRLQERYGGTVLPYGPDAGEFDPDSVTPHPRLVEEFGDRPLIVFVGTIRPHKGLDILAEALASMDTAAQLVIAGYDPYDIVPEIRDLLGDQVDFHGPIEHKEVPSYLAAATVIVIPQKRTRYTEAQIPNKVFEAMAMGKPIVASRVSDLSEIINGAGEIVEPDDPSSLASTLDELFSTPGRITELGEQARVRYIDNYSQAELEKKLNSILKEI